MSSASRITSAVSKYRVRAVPLIAQGRFPRFALENLMFELVDAGHRP